MKLTIKANSSHELKENIINLARSFGYDPAQQEIPLQRESDSAEEEKIKEEKKTRARKSKVDEVVITDSQPINSAPPPVAKDSVETNNLTREDVISAIKQVNITKGAEKAYAVLGKFNCSRVSEIKEELFPRFC